MTAYALIDLPGWSWRWILVTSALPAVILLILRRGLLFAAELGSRTIFVCTFWACLVAPYFVIFTFAPQVFAALGLIDARASTIAANGIAVLGAVVGTLTIERLGHRRQLIGPFWIMAAALLVVGLWTDAPVAVIVVCFALFAFFNTLSGNLTAVYPIEVFPTNVRASGGGVPSSISYIT